jgi:cellulose synthase/poly-beta-1,6-N-acetylglucosamine synthase-like glycosyltransferase
MEPTINYLKIGKATELTGKDHRFYRFLEFFPGFFSIFTIIILFVLSYFKPVWVAYFIIAFDIYWLFLVIYMAIFLVSSYRKLRQGLATDWRDKCERLKAGRFNDLDLIKEVHSESLSRQGVVWTDLWQLIVLPTSFESVEIIRGCLLALESDGYPMSRMIVNLAMEERAGNAARERAEIIQKEFGQKFGYFIITWHPDGIVGELKGKGANQAWAIQGVRQEIMEKENLDPEKILVSVFDIDTVVQPGYFFALTYKFLSVREPYHASYQPIPVYHNNIWNTPFFSRLTASSNTFWQMIMQIRQESLVTYSSHSMTFIALREIGYWSTTMVSEDSRIFWHCLLHYNGNYRVEPLYYKVSMDVTYDQNLWQTAKSLYKQQRRWAWGSENIPYLIFNTTKRWRTVDRGKLIGHILIQIHGFWSWATNALIIAVVGWMPMLLGGDRFNSTVLSGNLPSVTQKLMTVAMVGLVLSAVISSLLLPKRPRKYTIWKNIRMIIEWVFVPFTIIVFGAIPCFDAQIRLMRGKYMGFWITPKSR